MSKNVWYTNDMEGNMYSHCLVVDFYKHFIFRKYFRDKYNYNEPTLHNSDSKTVLDSCFPSVWLLAIPLGNCVTLGKLLSFPNSSFPHL